jgi:hypothetical protein
VSLVFTAPLPSGGVFSLTPRELGYFLFPWVGPVGLIFLLTSRVVELLFYPARSDGG